jgi:hypothetical protein
LRDGPSGVTVSEGEVDDREIGVELRRSVERFPGTVKHSTDSVARLFDNSSEIGG